MGFPPLKMTRMKFIASVVRIMLSALSIHKADFHLLGRLVNTPYI